MSFSAEPNLSCSAIYRASHANVYTHTHTHCHAHELTGKHTHTHKRAVIHDTLSNGVVCALLVKPCLLQLEVRIQTLLQTHTRTHTVTLFMMSVPYFEVLFCSTVPAVSHHLGAVELYDKVTACSHIVAHCQPAVLCWLLEICTLYVLYH